MAPPTVRDIMAFHTIDRRVYETLVAHGSDPSVARNAVSLFMWIEQIGVDVITQIITVNNPSVIFTLMAEVEAVMHCLRQEDDALNSYVEIPLISSLTQNAIDIRFFNFHKDVILRGLANIIDGVGKVIFDDNLYELLRAFEVEQERARRGLREGRPVVPSELAAVYNPRVVVPSAEDVRSMFITFSKGFPIKREQINDYFTERWGDCIDRVMMERTPLGGSPMYGRIVFKTESFIGLILNGERVVKFNINGRQLWARKYVPRSAVAT
ncbi:hypothetical protein LUZ60_001472 [Juncus effusus]|nr:hypothetical protein LUZ60_001472 [Juncus effusus]